MEELYNSKELSDVLFIIKDQKIYAHSFILIIHSSVFREQFDGTFHDSKVIPVGFTKNASTFLDFLKYFYYKQYELKEDNVIEIIKLAIKYKVYALEQMCYEFLWSRKFYIDTLKFYEIYKSENLKFLRDIQLLKIAFHIDTFLYSDKFLAIKRDTVADILRLDCLWCSNTTITDKKISEAVIFERVVKWAEHNRQSFGKCTKNLIGDLIKLIRFPTMQLDEFIECANNRAAIFTCDQICEIIKCITFKSGYTSFMTTPRTIHMDSMFVSKISTVQSHSTKFTVSDKMVMLGIWIQSPTNKQECTIKLTNQYDIILLETIVSTQYEYFCCPIRFHGDFELTPGHEYSVTICYSDPSVSVFLWTHYSENESVDNVTVNYSVQSPLITKIILDVP